MALEYKELLVDNEIIACEYTIRERNVVILHGAGSSSRNRYDEFARIIQSWDIGVILFDFSGHGSSSGNIKESSLKKRFSQARYVIDTLLPAGSEFYIIGFSMGAQIACDLLKNYTERIPAVLFGCPGIYDQEAKSIPFGNKEFTNILRTTNSWQNSDAFEAIRLFKGTTIIAIGADDTVIPKGIVDKLIDNAVNGVIYRYENVDHQLAKWLSGNPEELSSLISKLLA